MNNNDTLIMNIVASIVILSTNEDDDFTCITFKAIITLYSIIKATLTILSKLLD